jgi:crotonobetainyl-CoA:carnitine CoA-transferase CaiB-like acyl-CoA transferase
MRQLLDDIVVLELSEEGAGAYCAKVFADLGADVVKVERPEGDPLRAHPGAFLHLNTNKRSVVADPADPSSRARVAQLIRRADVVIQSLGSGDLARWDTSWDAEHERNPALVMASISGFGAFGPYASYTWADLVAQATSWFVYPQGLSDKVPIRLPGMVGLCAVGHTAAVGALSAFLRARHSGAGAFVDLAAYEALAAVPSRVGRFLGWEYLGRQPPAPVVTSTSGTLIPTGIFPCEDGFVSMMSTPQQLPEMLAVLDDDDLREAFARPDAFLRGETKEILDAALYPWLFSHTRADAMAAAQAAGWPFSAVNTPAEVLEVDHLHQRGFWVEVDDPVHGRLNLPGAPYRHAEGGWRLRRQAPTLGQHDAEIDAELATTATEPARPKAPATEPEAPPLRGIRVLDFTTVWSGPFVTLLLADLGAEVIRVENPSVFPPTTKGYVPRPNDEMLLGSLLAQYAPMAEGRPDRPWNRHALNNSIARNKLSVTLDPRRPDCRELFMQLVAQSDVFIENLKASTLHQMGIHESQLMDRNPRLVVVRIPPAGLTGDWAGYTGFGAQFDGLSGLTWMNGHPDASPIETPPTTYMDFATGPAGAFAIISALHYREATGRGQIVELAQMENVLNQLGDVFVDCQLGPEPPRIGNRDHLRAPQGMYRTREVHHWLAISVSDDRAWTALAGVIGRPELADDPRFADLIGRQANHDELDRLLDEWTSGQDMLEAFHVLQAAGVAAGPQLDEAMLVADPNVAARDWLRPLNSGDVGTHLHIGHTFRGIPQVWERGSPTLGEDNEYVYKKVLGLDDDEYERLVAAKVIVTDYLDADGNAY